MSQIYARKYIDESGILRFQALEEHHQNVGSRMEKNIPIVELKLTGKIIGFIHDAGKAHILWQKYLLQDIPRSKVNHAIWGALIVREIFMKELERKIVNDNKRKQLLQIYSSIVQNVLLSHHGILKDLNEVHEFWEVEYEDDILEEIWSYLQTIFSNEQWHSMFQLAFEQFTTWILSQHTEQNWRISIVPVLTHYLYSCLIDCDWYDAEEFQNKLKPSTDKRFRSLHDGDVLQYCLQQMKSKMQTLPSVTPIDQLRANIHKKCVAAFKKNTAIYTLASPVGAGKTYSSLDFALHHAEFYKKKRIIIFLPYVSIIEQNANDIRNILNAKDLILEHHGQVYKEDHLLNEQSNKVHDINWDFPIIVTTFYQFMQAVYGGNGRTLRRFQYMSNSILIFDEVQTLPTSSIGLFNMAIQFIVKQLKSTVLLCTATQPALDSIIRKKTHSRVSPVQQMIELQNVQPLIDETGHAEQFKRCNFHYIRKCFTTKQLLQHIVEKSEQLTKGVLCICNTKSAVRALYQLAKEQLSDEVPIYQLSTYMCPEQRYDIFEEVKAYTEQQKFVLCISTSLIEAGVNISFPIVYRSLARIDSIIQASGRCNRDGKYGMGNVYIYDCKEDILGKHLVEIDIGKQITIQLLKGMERGTLAKEFIDSQNTEWCFKKFYAEVKGKILYPYGRSTLFDLLFTPRPMKQGHYAQHKTVMQNFHMYGEDQISLIAPYKKGKELITRLNNEEQIEIKTFQRYIVNVYAYEFNQLLQLDAIKQYEISKREVVWIIDETYYGEAGLTIPTTVTGN